MLLLDDIKVLVQHEFKLLKINIKILFNIKPKKLKKLNKKSTQHYNTN